MGVYENVSRIYDDVAHDYHEKVHRTSDHITEFIKILPRGGKILEVGCGTGFDARYMMSKGFDVVGVDISTGMLGIAKKVCPKANFLQADIKTVEFDSKSFDGIFAAFSLIHLPKSDVPQVLEKFSTWIRPGGVIYIAVQSGESKERLIPAFFQKKGKFFLNVFSKEEIIKLLNNTGFSVVSCYQREPKENELKFIKLFILAIK